MNIELSALSSDQRRPPSEREGHVRKVDYPKSEPVLESSYVFPKEKRYVEWRFTHGVVSVPKDC